MNDISTIGESDGQSGGKYIGEGVDGCIFSAPGNWPCQTPLKGYSPHDTNLVSKIVQEDDIEGNILSIIRHISHDNYTKYKRYNLIKYIGTCKPKLRNFSKTEKRTYILNKKQLNTTERACKTFKNSLDNLSRTSNPYKQYILGKYEMTYKEFTSTLLAKEITRDKIADILYNSYKSMEETLLFLIHHPIYSVINYDIHSKNLGIYKNPQVKEYSITNHHTFQIGPADFGKVLYKLKNKQYNFQTFMTWDYPYLQMFFTKDDDDDKDKTYSNFNQYSFEARLINYIVTHHNKKPGIPNKLWIEYLYEDSYIQKRLREKDVYDIFLFYMKKFITDIKSPVSTIRYKYIGYEKKLEEISRKLSYKSSKDQYKLLKQDKYLQEFFDEIKSRSHISTTLGVFLIHGFRACGYSIQEIKSIIGNPLQAKIKIPTKLQFLLFTYIQHLYCPFSK